MVHHSICTIWLWHQKGFVCYTTIPIRMARNNTIVLSDSEQESLQSVRQEMFGSDEVPYGVVVTKLIDHWQNSEETNTANLDD